MSPIDYSELHRKIDLCVIPHRLEGRDVVQVLLGQIQKAMIQQKFPPSQFNFTSIDGVPLRWVSDTDYVGVLAVKKNEG